MAANGTLALTDGDDLPAVEVVREVVPYDGDDRVHFRTDHASFPIGDGRVRVERSPAVARMRSPEPLTDDDLAHPWLSRAGAMFGHWSGREVLHGGAFVQSGLAWAVLGDTEAGKSTLLAALADRGREVLSDDVLVLDRGAVLAGARCVDLRPGTARAIGVTAARPARAGTRDRLDLPPTAAAAPLGGIVHLAWGDGPRAARVAAERRIVLLRDRNWLGELDSIDKRALLDLAALPTVELIRPRALGGVRDSAAALLDAIEDRPAAHPSSRPRSRSVAR
ncbi:MAG TPA: hypothetical protein VJT75_16770 [Thermoleophilaceae bacterium]|nr:hypothetical protein [Thermoleophilaceae bacterium]